MSIYDPAQIQDRMNVVLKAHHEIKPEPCWDIHDFYDELLSKLEMNGWLLLKSYDRRHDGRDRDASVDEQRDGAAGACRCGDERRTPVDGSHDGPVSSDDAQGAVEASDSQRRAARASIAAALPEGITEHHSAVAALERIEEIYTTMEGAPAMEAVRQVALDARMALRGRGEGVTEEQVDI